MALSAALLQLLQMYCCRAVSEVIPIVEQSELRERDPFPEPTVLSRSAGPSQVHVVRVARHAC